MNLKNNYEFFTHLLKINLKSLTSLRGAFLLQATFMIINNLVFFTMWWVFFKKFKSIKGWEITDLCALYGVVAFVFGVSVIFFGGVRSLAKMIDGGDLDVYLTQPKNTLFYASSSQSHASGWGDVVSGIILLWFSGYLTFGSLPLMLTVLFCSFVVFVCIGILFNSLAFWMGPMDSLARQFYDFVVTFSIYPQVIFSQFLKMILFTVIPGGFIGHLPVSLLREFSWSNLGFLVVGSAGFFILSVVVFNRGLKKYESGNRFIGVGTN
ncbi:MAG: hypothetical protein HOE90_04020 [Bacteriovoracaceae bacterium]|nr:hypothetical protein [Bacteriovoracaceae bacterium]